LEPLQQEAERMIEELQTEKGRLAQTHAERREVLKEHMTTQDVETLVEKNVQEKETTTKMENKFHALEVALQKVN
jgi:hypothetical protein